MIFSHIADTHLGLEQYGSEEREKDVYRVFNQAIDISINDHVDFVIFSGDIFHVPNPNGTAIIQMANALKRLKNKNIDTFFILGEHDISRIRTTPVHYVYHNLEVSKYIGQGEPVTYKNDVLICGFDKIRKNEIPQFEDQFKKVNDIAKNHQGHRIMVMHQGITEFNKFAGELQSTDMPPDFTYYAMGHLHDHDIREFSHLNGPVAYPGSIELMPGEKIKKTKKGFIEVDISTSEAKPSWIQLDARPQLSYQVDYNKIESVIDDIVKEAEELQREPIIKLEIQGNDIEHELIQAQVSRLDKLSLRCSWGIAEKKETDESVLLSDRPSIIDDALLQLSAKVTNSDETARFAIKELLPLLSSNQIDEASQIIIEDFEQFKKENAKK